MIGWRPVAALARLELTRLARSRIAFTLLLLVPLLQILLFGYAVRPNGMVSVAIAAPPGPAADAVARALRGAPGIRLAATGLPQGAAEAQVRAGQALIGVEIPPQRSLANPFAPILPVRVVVDASNAGLTAAAVPRIEAAYWHALAEREGVAANGPGLAIERLYNPEARPDWTFLPALIGVTVMIAMIMLGTLSLAREREGGSWEALRALPLPPFALLIGKLSPYVAIGTVQGVLVLLIGHALFALPVRGSIGALIALLPLFAAAHLMLGYAISARAATQLAALQGAVAFYLPAMLLSGFLYPFETLPGWARALGALFPLTHWIRAAQGALLRGEGAGAVLAHGLPMLGFLAAATLAARILQDTRLD